MYMKAESSTERLELAAYLSVHDPEMLEFFMQVRLQFGHAKYVEYTNDDERRGQREAPAGDKE